MKSVCSNWLAGWLALVSALPCSGLEPIPDKLVVLTFDDSVASHYSVVRPLLKQYKFSATFFITEGFSFPTNKKDYMTWEQIAELHRDGFEIGNHTRDHMGISVGNLGRLPEQIEAINTRCDTHGIPRPTSFAFPGNAIVPGALPILKKAGIRFARRGGAPEYSYEGGRGVAYEPGVDHPLLIPSAGDARPHWSLADFQRSVEQARGGRIAVLQFHGVPDNEHPWVHTTPAQFGQYMKFLHENGYRAIALRDLASYVDPEISPTDPYAIIEKRKAARAETAVQCEILDEATGKPVASRIYVQDENGGWHFANPGWLHGSAVRYQRSSRFNSNAVEMHTTVSAHPCQFELPPGRYTFTVERGKEYFAAKRSVTVGREPLKLTFPLRRWIDMASLGWYSGDTHVHREPAELPNAMLAEDVNVVFPMVYWTTDSETPPSQSERNFKGDFAAAPVRVDATHVYYPRNTEYEIFRTAKRQHTLGALLAINHKTIFDLPALPISRVAERAHSEGALLDLDKHNWPWSMALVPLVRPDLFELANNHFWRTEFSITNWGEPAPGWMQVGTGSGTERDWMLYGFANYYTLLNCGFRLRPTAGTANGVHPVPLGFSRVYVQLDNGFSYDDWVRGLDQGRSFVTTGPMLMIRVNSRSPGHVFRQDASAISYRLTGRAVSEHPLREIEVIVNGEKVQTIRPQNHKTTSGAYENEITAELSMDKSSWVIARCFEERPDGRLRFAHTAPFHFEVPQQPLRPRREEIGFLVQRVKDEITRSGAILPPPALDEYRKALAIYEEMARTAR